MIIAEIQQFIKEQMEAHPSQVVEREHRDWAIPEVRTCLEYLDSTSDEPMADWWTYRLGQFRQPTTSVPDASLFYISMEPNSLVFARDTKFCVIDERIANYDPNYYDEAFATDVINRIKDGRLTLLSNA